MKKTISININGIFFYIDDDAYTMLNDYMEELALHFKNTAGKDEIIEDIESRIGEILQTKISPQKQVIQISDIEEVISILGKPEDFTEGSTTTTDKEQNYSFKNKRLYRDPDNRVLGGVAAGIAHYFNIDPIWIRLAFIITFFFSGPIIYVIAWIIIPKARTTAEKLEMKGEHINISQIEKNIKEEFEFIKQKMNDLKEEAQEYYKKKRTTTINSTQSRLFGFLENIIKYGFKAIAIFVGIILFITGTALVFALLATILSGHHHFILPGTELHYISLHQLLYIFMPEGGKILMATTGLALLIVIPVAMVIIAGIKLILGIPKQMKIVSFLATMLWLAGFFITFFLILNTSQKFHEKATLQKNYHCPKSYQTSILKATPLPHFQSENEWEVNSNEFHLVYNKKNNSIFTYPSIQFIAAPSDKTEINLIKQSRGQHYNAALSNAENIAYQVNIQDSIINISEVFLTPLPWRNQQVKMHIYIPIGHTIYIDNSMRSILHSENKEGDSHNNLKIPAYYQMTEYGLQKID